MKDMRRDDRGMTLVELLAAFAVSAVVLTGVTYMLTTSLKLSEKNNANVQLQSETQTALALIADNIMEAKGIGLKTGAAGESTDCILFGDILIKKLGTGYEAYYKGNAIIADTGAGKTGEIYLAEFPNDAFDAGADGYCKLAAAAQEAACVSESMDKVKKYVMDTPQPKRIKWLMAQGITEFTVLPDSVYGEKTVKENGMDVVKTLYEEPFTLKISLTANSAYGSDSLTRTLSDKIAVRNRLNKIYLTKPGAGKDRMEIYERQN